MHDPQQPFEARLGAALGRYADQVPTDVDAVAFVRATRVAPVPSRLFWRPASSLRLVLVLGLLLALAIAAAALVGALPSPRIYSSVFTPTGSMAVPRSGHTATLLRDGRVLITGGEDDQHRFIAMAELYDPATDTFSETGQLTAGIADCCGTIAGRFAITPLTDGRALTIGGIDGKNPIARAELYDPGTGTFTPTGPLLEPRRDPTATLLGDGRVLVAGGYGEPSGLLMTAELYDPATGIFTATGRMSGYATTATLLLDGRVLVTAPGYGDGTPELYDPGAGTFTPTGPMIDEDLVPTASLLLDGRVLFTGTQDGSTAAELYDPTTGTFTATGSMATPHDTATPLQDGRVLVSGGFAVPDNVATAELYDPRTATFTPTGSLNEPRSGATATLLADGSVLIAGGAGQDHGLLDSAELYR